MSGPSRDVQTCVRRGREAGAFIAHLPRPAAPLRRRVAIDHGGVAERHKRAFLQSIDDHARLRPRRQS